MVQDDRGSWRRGGSIQSRRALREWQRSSRKIIGKPRVGIGRQRKRGSSRNAQFNLGTLFDTGKGVPQDYKEAARWYRLAAEQEHPDAAYNLAVLYAGGQGVEKDLKEAARWYQVAADHGQIEAEYNLGVQYSEGQGVAQDFEQASRWYRKAAEQGHRDAQYNLGGLYATGRGVPPNLPQAYKWFSLAAAAGDRDATAVLARLSAKMTPGEMEAGKAAVAEWQPCKGKDDCAERTRD